MNPKEERTPVDVIAELVRNLPPQTIAALAARFESLSSTSQVQSILDLAQSPAMRERLRVIGEAIAPTSKLDGRSVALALRATAQLYEVEVRAKKLELAWTGPGTDQVPTRRVDQVFYEIIDQTRETLILVTYACYGADKTIEALSRAVNRGVKVRLVLELAEESGGKLSFDSSEALRDALIGAEIFYWPVERRPKSPTGKYGSMHAKVLVGDDTQALVSSANLTDYALELNMEMGVRFEGGPEPKRIAAHFRSLIHQGELVQLM